MKTHVKNDTLRESRYKNRLIKKQDGELKYNFSREKENTNLVTTIMRAYDTIGYHHNVLGMNYDYVVNANKSLNITIDQVNDKYSILEHDFNTICDKYAELVTYDHMDTPGNI